jgi:hypothetical protein
MKLLLTTLAAAATLAAIPAAAQTSADDARFRTAQDRFDREYQLYRQAVDQYQRARTGNTGSNSGYQNPAYRDPAADDRNYRRAPDPYADGYQGEDLAEYDPARDYRAGNQYRERVLSPSERVYAGYDGRYYCRRSDGTTGLIVGAAAGGILGNVIDGGRSRVLGTLLGGAGGAVAGRAVEQSQVRCR